MYGKGKGDDSIEPDWRGREEISSGKALKKSGSSQQELSGLKHAVSHARLLSASWNARSLQRGRCIERLS